MHLYQLIKLKKSIMKKLAIASAVLALSASSAMSADDAFYFKAGGFGNMGMGIKLHDNFPNTTTLDRKGQYGEYGYGGTFGLGYHLMDNVRGEINASYIFSSGYKGKTWTDTELKDKPNLTQNLNELSISGAKLMVNSYADVINLGSAKLYGGIGIGSSYIAAEVKGQAIDKEATDNNKAKDADTTQYGYGLNFAYEIGAGVSYEITDGIAVQLGYTLENLGMPGDQKKKNDDDTTLSWKYHVSESSIWNHNVNLALRFSL
jgi:opacity protein-like surface antigen